MPHPHATALRLRVRVVRVDVARARTLLSSGPLVAQVMWRACGLKDRCYQGVAHPTTGLPVLPGLVCLSARGHRPGHAAVRELSSSRVFRNSIWRVPLTLIFVGHLWWDISQICSHRRHIVSVLKSVSMGRQAQAPRRKCMLHNCKLSQHTGACLAFFCIWLLIWDIRVKGAYLPSGLSPFVNTNMAATYHPGCPTDLRCGLCHRHSPQSASEVT